MSAVQSREPDQSVALVSGGRVIPKLVRTEGIINQIRYGQIERHRAERGELGNKLGDVHHDWLGAAAGPEVRQVALVTIWVDPDAHPQCPLACQP